MLEKISEATVTFFDLDWDSKFFGVSSAKAVLNQSLSSLEWNELKIRFKDYQFISIENRNSEPMNAQLIGRDTTAFLADINIQFVKKLTDQQKMPKNISVHQALKRDNRLIHIADFQFSKFTEDIELAERGGDQVYNQWLINSFENKNKFFVISKDDRGTINGFLLYSYANHVCVIELIAVSKNVTKSGVGTSLFNGVEFTAFQDGFKEINVGTQIRNIGAINFYHKVGCKQVGCHQVYHLWNL